MYPARVRHPKDKALVENAVKLIYKSIYPDIEGMVFHDLSSLNEAILNSLKVLNERKMSGRDTSRKELFDNTEADFLRELPAMRYRMKERKSVTVMKNSYFTLFKHHYSVPSQCYTQKASHDLPGRRGSYEQDIEGLYQRAADIDNIVLIYLKEVAEEKKYPPTIFRTCRGILSLENKYGQDRLVAACACATQKKQYGYHVVNNILENGEDADFLNPDDSDMVTSSHMTVVEHKNIRGREYYSKTNNSQINSDNGNK